MKTIEQHLGQYAQYHRDQRSILTHYAGIPLIVFSLLCLLSRPVFGTANLPLIGDLLLSPALVVWIVGNVFYFKLDLRFGIVMALLTGALLYVAQAVALSSTPVWLLLSVGIFVGGWVLQFIGHYYEGKKPAFVDDLMGLAIGPLFVVAEVAFELGLRPELKQSVEAVAGPVH